MAKMISNGKHFQCFLDDLKGGLFKRPEPSCQCLARLGGGAIVLSVLLFVLTASGASAQTTCQGPAYSTLTINWMTQSVCTLNGVVQHLDPCSCPTTTGYAVIAAPGDIRLPYHKTDQRLPDPWTYDDSYRAVEPWGGNVLSVYPAVEFGDVSSPTVSFSVFENASSIKWPELTQSNWGNYFSQVDSGTVGFHDWATGTETQNSNGYGFTFCIGTNSGTNYEVPGGWIEFPAPFITTQPSNGATGWAIPWVSSLQWERNQLVWPGYANPQNPPYVADCNGKSLDGHETFWTYYSGFNFGSLDPSQGINTNVKIIPAIQSVHAFPASQAAYKAFVNISKPAHFETTYWTQLYGHTRWEAWFSASVVTGTPSLLADAEDVVSSGRCSVANGESLTTDTNGKQIITTNSKPANYSSLGLVDPNNPNEPVATEYPDGLPIVMTLCADFTKIELRSDPTPPVYPIPDLNLLSNYDFAVNGSGTPHLLPTCSATSTNCWYVTGSPDTVYVKYSTVSGDTPDTNYLQVTCPASYTCVVQQSVPASWTREPSGDNYTLTNDTYLIGVTARTEADASLDQDTIGSMTLALTSGSNSFTVPSSPSTFTVSSNGTSGNLSLDSILLASKYFGVSTYPDTNDPNTDVVPPPSMDSPFTVNTSDPLTLTITLQGGNDSNGNPLVYDIVNAWLEKASY